MKIEEIFTDESKVLTKLYLTALAVYEEMFPIVTGYQTEILKELDARDHTTGNPITSKTFIFLADRKTQDLFYERCKEEARKLGLSYKPKRCPLDEPEEIFGEAKRMLGQHLLSILPGYQNYTLAQMAVFDKKEGRIYKDQFGNFVTRLDRIIEISLKVLVPLITETNENS